MPFAAHFFLRQRAAVAGLAALVMRLLAYQRYVNQRWKLTELADATAVIVHKASVEAPPAATEPE